MENPVRLPFLSPLVPSRRLGDDDDGLFVVSSSTSLLFFVTFVQATLTSVVADWSLSADIVISFFASVITVHSFATIPTAGVGDDLDHVIVSCPSVPDGLFVEVLLGFGGGLGDFDPFVFLGGLGRVDNDGLLGLGQGHATAPSLNKFLNHCALSRDFDFNSVAVRSVDLGEWFASLGVQVACDVSGIAPASVTEIKVSLVAGIWVGTEVALGSMLGKAVHDKILIVAWWARGVDLRGEADHALSGCTLGHGVHWCRR